MYIAQLKELLFCLQCCAMKAQNWWAAKSGRSGKFMSCLILWAFWAMSMNACESAIITSAIYVSMMLCVSLFLGGKTCTCVIQPTFCNSVGLLVSTTEYRWLSRSQHKTHFFTFLVVGGIKQTTHTQALEDSSKNRLQEIGHWCKDFLIFSYHLFPSFMLTI